MADKNKVADALENFEAYLVENTLLQPTTIIEYVNEVKYYFKIHHKINLNMILKHIRKQHRDSNNNKSKYALKHFLIYIGDRYGQDTREHILRLPKLKNPPRKKMNRQLDPDIIIRVLATIQHPIYRDVAALQLATGARSSEIITLRHENIDMTSLMALIMGKGRKAGYIQFAEHLRPILQKYVRAEKGYLFLPDEMYVMTKKQPIEYQRRLKRFNDNYYQQVRKAGKDCGIVPFGTHDFRRAFSQEFYKTKPDLVALQQALRHARITTTVIYLPPFTAEVQDTIKEVQRRFNPK